MQLKDLLEPLAKIGLPLIGTALAGPAGAGIGAALASHIGSPSAKAEDILATLTASSDAVLKAKQFEQTHQEVMLKLHADYALANRSADSADLANVNQTMQSEGKSEHWLQWSWRPLNGYALAIGSVALVLGVLAMAGIAVYNKDFATLNAIPTVVMAVTAALAVPGAVCGVTAWHRGVTQRIEAGEVK